MAGPFDITTTTNTIRLDDKRQAEVSFSAFNNSGRQIRGRAIIVPQNPASATPASGTPTSGTQPPTPNTRQWLTLVGDAEKDFPIASTLEYKVSIAVPPDAPPGTYPFRLDVVGVENPDELLSQGPSVTFEVPAPVVKKQAFPVWIPLVIIGALLLVGGVIAFLALRTTPNGPKSATATPTPTQLPLTGAARYVGDWVATKQSPLGVEELVIDRNPSGKKLFVEAFDLDSANKATKQGDGVGLFEDDPFVVAFTSGFFNHQFTITPNNDASALTVKHQRQVGQAPPTTATLTFEKKKLDLRTIDPGRVNELDRLLPSIPFATPGP